MKTAQPRRVFGFIVRRSKTDPGYALITTLMFTSILIVMLSALFLTVREKLFQSQTYHDQVAALYVAELAISDAMIALEADPDWVAGFHDKTFAGVPGTYSVDFNTSGPPFTKNHSVNNVRGMSSESFRGPVTVLPGHCLLVATANVGKSTRTVEALVKIGGGYLALDVPLLVDGKIVLEGGLTGAGVTIEGVKSLTNPLPVPAGLHSNLSTAAPDLVTVDDTGASTISITGVVSSSSSDPNAIDTGSYVPAVSPVTSAPQKTVPNIDILGTVASKMGGTAVPATPPPVIMPGYSPSPPFLGTVTLTHAGGPEYSHSGNLNLVGDLELQGSSLYVQGNLHVTGSITGSGSIWVSGETDFRGTSKVTSSTPDRVALYSHGGVSLQGYDGSKAMDGYAANLDIQTSWDTVKDALNTYPGELDLIHSVADLGDDSAHLDQDFPPSVRNMIGSGADGRLSPTKGAAGNLITNAPTVHNTSFPGQALLWSKPTGEDRDFLIRRFFELYQLNFGVYDDTPDELTAAAWARAGRLERAGVDAINDQFMLDRIPLIRAMVAGVDFNHPGQAYFQGQVYTHGYIYAKNEVAIIGALVTSLDSGSPAPASKTDLGRTIDPGDVVILNGCRFLFVEDFFKPASVSGPSDPGAKVVLWNGR